MRPRTTTGQSALRIWVFWFFISATFSALSIAYIDRPLASFIDGHFRYTFGWTVLSHLLEPLKVVALSAFVLLVLGRVQNSLRPWLTTLGGKSAGMFLGFSMGIGS